MTVLGGVTRICQLGSPSAHRRNQRELIANGVLRSTIAAMQHLGLDAAEAHARALDLLNIRVIRQATVLAYNHVFQLITLLFIIAVPLVMLLQKRAMEGHAEIMAE